MPLQTLWMGTNVKLTDFVEVDAIPNLTGIYLNLLMFLDAKCDTKKASA